MILGVDPGATGALAWLNPDGTLAAVADMPSVDGIVSGALLTHLLDQHPHVDEAWVEQVAARPGQGVSSVFKFGRSYGAITGVLEARLIPVHYVTPAKWKGTARVNAPKGATVARRKAISRRRALDLWPDHADRFARAMDADRAEAALIARHGWLTTRGPDQ
ncbi:MAG: hypothetical protein U5R31_03145 [Acidimicrobiia bacterium]|nr:hypothetical protein [Acidimicrobiia bacterium]